MLHSSAVGRAYQPRLPSLLHNGVTLTCDTSTDIKPGKQTHKLLAEAAAVSFGELLSVEESLPSYKVFSTFFCCFYMLCMAYI